MFVITYVFDSVITDYKTTTHHLLFTNFVLLAYLLFVVKFPVTSNNTPRVLYLICKYNYIFKVLFTHIMQYYFIFANLMQMTHSCK